MWCRVTEGEEAKALLEGSRYQLKLLPHKSLSLWLTFAAGKEASFNFVMPIALLGYGFSVAGTLFDPSNTMPSHHVFFVLILASISKLVFSGLALAASMLSACSQNAIELALS